MSDHGDPTAEPLPRRTNSITKRSRWPGWIWSVPIAAVGIVTWLLIRAFSQGGIDVTVTFEDAAGMKARDTQVVYHGLEIGKVRSVELTTDRRGVIARLDLDKSVKDELTTGTHFYLQGAQLSFSDPDSLKAIISGPTIDMTSGPGSPSRRFAGQVGEPPVHLAVSVPFVAEFRPG